MYGQVFTVVGLTVLAVVATLWGVFRSGKDRCHFDRFYCQSQSAVSSDDHWTHVR